MWREKALPHISEKDFDENRWKFGRAWETASVPLRRTLLDVALDRAEKMTDPPSASIYQDERKRYLVRVILAMQQVAGDREFPLSCHQVAALVNIKPMQANRWLHGFVADGVVTCVSRGKPGQPGHNAARWRFGSVDVLAAAS